MRIVLDEVFPEELTSNDKFRRLNGLTEIGEFGTPQSGFFLITAEAPTNELRLADSWSINTNAH